jgi:3-methyl-2-oxobutanoate hydroxymethyltransferase
MMDKFIRLKTIKKITMLACYDYSFATIMDAAGLDIILVGDSMANVVLGMSDTKGISVAEMVNHTKAVATGAKNSLVITDAPYLSYQKNPKKALYYMQKFMDAGADGVKIEWFKDCPKVIADLRKNGIPVMGHIGLTPQTAHLIGGFKVQGRDVQSAKAVVEQAKMLEALGVFSLVLECVPRQLGTFITKSLSIPTIGIGAGSGCRGQVMVSYDLLGLYSKPGAKFVRRYVDLQKTITNAVKRYIADVRTCHYPALNESYAIDPHEWKIIEKKL